MKPNGNLDGLVACSFPVKWAAMKTERQLATVLEGRFLGVGVWIKCLTDFVQIVEHDIKYKITDTYLLSTFLNVYINSILDKAGH